jgi:hypothetical protein
MVMLDTPPTSSAVVGTETTSVAWLNETTKMPVTTPVAMNNVRPRPNREGRLRPARRTLPRPKPDALG